jgi:hypothetical protein
MKTIMFQRRGGKIRAINVEAVSIESHAVILSKDGKLFRFTANFNLNDFIKISDSITVILCYIGDDTKLYPLPTTPTDSVLPISAYETSEVTENLEIIAKTNELEEIVKEIEFTNKENEDLMGILPSPATPKKEEKKSKNSVKGKWKVSWEA